MTCTIWKGRDKTIVNELPLDGRYRMILITVFGLQAVITITITKYNYE